MYDHEPTHITDDDRIAFGVELAEIEGRVIDDACSRRIAMQFHTGQASEFYTFGSCGAIRQERLAPEFTEAGAENPDEQSNRWLGALALYVGTHGDRPEQPGWYDLTADYQPIVMWLEGGDGR